MMNLLYINETFAKEIKELIILPALSSVEILGNTIFDICDYSDLLAGELTVHFSEFNL